MLQLNTIKAQPGARKGKKRLGRGSGSGHGKTAGKGHKGQLARTGGSVRPGFEGGQMPLYRRIPKRGFTSLDRRKEALFNVADLEKFDAKALPEVTLESLAKANLLKGRYDRLIILGTGEIKKAFTVKAHRVSESAQEKIQKAGGKVEILPIPGMNGKRKPRKAVSPKTKAKA